MNAQNTGSTVHPVSLKKRILQGAGIALVLISLFLLSADEPHPGWHELWMLKPLLLVPIAGAMGGLFHCFMDHLRSQSGWIKVIAYNISITGYLFALWVGTILGLNGTCGINQIKK